MQQIKKHITDTIIVILSIAIAVLVGLVTKKLELAVAILSFPAALLTSKHYGDVAGTKAAIEHEERKAAEARVTAFKALLNEVKQARKLAERNSAAKWGRWILPIARIPVNTFETAFVSGVCVEASSELLNATTDYLTAASLVDTCVDISIAATPGAGHSTERITEAVDKAKTICETELPQILDKLESALRQEHESAIEALKALKQR